MKLSRVGKDPFEFILLQEKEKGTELLYTTGFHQTVLWKTATASTLLNKLDALMSRPRCDPILKELEGPTKDRSAS